jgi:hypothetical protein
MGLELRVEAAVEDAADQKGSLDRVGARPDSIMREERGGRTGFITGSMGSKPIRRYVPLCPALSAPRLLLKPAVHPASWRLGGDEGRFGFEQFTPAAVDVFLGQHMTRQTHEDRVVAELG